MPIRYWIILIILGAMFGASFGLNEILSDSYGPLTISTVRIAIGALGCWVWILASKRRAAVPKSAIALLGVYGTIQYAIPFAVLPLAQEHITSSVAGIANAMTPVAVVVISHLWVGGERATPHKTIGVLFGVAGIVALSWQGEGAMASDPRYIFVAMLAPICYGTALNLVRRLTGIDPIVITTWALTGGALVMMPVMLLLEGIPATPDAQEVLGFSIFGLVLTSIVFLVLFSIMPRVGATNLSLVTFVAPISAIGIGAIFLHEHIGLAERLGVALILAGLLAIDGRAFAYVARLRSGNEGRDHRNVRPGIATRPPPLQRT